MQGGLPRARAGVATGRRGAVAAAHPLAARDGLEVMREGGNAVDAAVTTAFTLTVVEPFGSGIAGGGFMTVRLADGGSHFLDFRETAPARATPTMFPRAADGTVPDRLNDLGYLPIGVPGQLAGMVEALARWGTISLDRALAPAIEHAERGFPVSPFMATIMGREVARLRLTPDGARRFLTDTQEPLPVGSLVRQPELAESYRRIARDGAELFYRGELARRLVEQVAAGGGRLDLDDLAAYRPRLREPVSGRFAGFEVVSSPPPSSGGFTLLLLLQMWAALDLPERDADDPEGVHLMVEAMKLAFADRRAYAADADFMPVPVAGLMSPAYARDRARLVDPARAQTFGAGQPERYSSPSTTHLSAVDGQGNAVALTQTLQAMFGSGVVVEGTGIFLNNQLSDFDPDPASPNRVEAGKKPLSSMSPTIVLREGRPELVIGSAGSQRIITAVGQAILHHLGRGRPIAEAIADPRYHCERDEVALEGSAPPAVVAGLRERGHRLLFRGEGPVNFLLGGVQAVAVGADGLLTAVCDPRRTAGDPAAF